MINQGTINNSLTRGNKAEIVGWGMPDWDSIILFGSSGAWSSYTAPSDGFFLLSGGADTAQYIGSNYVRANITFGQYTVKLGGYGAASFIPVKKGSVISKNDSYGANNAYFIPYKL